MLKNLLSKNPADEKVLFENMSFFENEIDEINAAQEQTHVSEHLKKRKYYFEIIVAIVLCFLIALITWGQLNFFGTDSWIFFVLINMNAILMLVVLFLVSRNIIRLLLERRRKIFGVRLKTRLVLAFFSISFVPILIMFLAANKILTTSVNYWFTGQVENSMQAALDVGHSFYEASSNRLKTHIKLLSDDLSKIPETDWEEYIFKHKTENQLTLLGVMKQNDLNLDSAENPNKLNATYAEKFWFADASFNSVWNSIRHSINFGKVESTGFDSLLWADEFGDYVVIVLPIPENSNLYIIVAESIGKGLLTQLDSISTGFREYTELKNLKQPLKLSFSLILGLLSLIVLFASIWLAFRMSRELTQPILALAKGTKHIAQGDMNFQVTDKGQDELGQLVHSFNAMTNEVRVSQERLKNMNWLIEENNETLLERNQYIEAILENITTGVVTLDEKGFVVTINKAVCDIFKIRAEQYEGLSIDMFLRPEHLSMMQEMYTFIQENPEKTWIREVELLRSEQYAKILIQALALPSFMKEERSKSDSSQENSSIFEDFDQNLETKLEEEKISENNKTLQKELNCPTKNNAYRTGSIILVVEDITELSQEQRVNAWREVARRIAHEIKNPLTPIKLSAERLQRKFGKNIDDPVFAQCTDLIVREVARMQSMVADFSSFAALPRIHLILENPMPILYELLSLFKTSHPKIEWTITEKVNIPNIYIDKQALHRALFNILSNAADAINTERDLKKEEHFQGHVEIICDSILQDAASNVIDISSSDIYEENLKNTIIIEIHDNGAGMNAEESARLFEPYFSKKATGTGLGLPIVKSIITDHDGVINAYQKEKGMCIRISLPSPV